MSCSRNKTQGDSAGQRLIPHEVKFTTRETKVSHSAYLLCVKIPPLNLNSTRDSPPLGTKFNLQAQVDDLCSSGCKQRQVFVSWHQDLVKEEIFILALRENHVITRHNSACRCDVCVSCLQITDI